MSVNRFKYTLKNLQRGIRFINGEIKVGPRFINVIGKAYFKVVEGKLFHGEKEIIPEEEVNEKITEYDASPLYSGGRDRLWNHLSDKYVGISRSAVMKFISNSALHQVTTPQKKKIQSRPIVITKPGIYVQIDLVDMQKYSGLNNGYNWILTYVDLFSKFAQARPMKSKHVKNVMAAMDDIFKDIPASYRPRTIQADNGSEFKTQFEKHMKSKYTIRVIHSQAYNPSSQGAVERFNKTIKSMIYQFMTRFDSKRWIDLLPSLIANYNSTMHSSTRQKPIDIMGNMKDSMLVTQVYDRLKKKAEKVIEGNDSGETFNVGDSVRVLLTSDARKRKNQFEKRIAQNWSNDVYQVRSVSKPTEQYNQPQYLLMKGTRKLTKRYYNWHLLRVDPLSLHDDIKPIADRPVFDAKLFDKEKHLRTGKIKNIKVDTILPAPEKRARSSRNAKKPSRFKD
jgi:hypothetical protein